MPVGNWSNTAWSSVDAFVSDTMKSAFCWKSGDSDVDMIRTWAIPLPEPPTTACTFDAASGRRFRSSKYWRTASAIGANPAADLALSANTTYMFTFHRIAFVCMYRVYFEMIHCFVF